MVNTRESGISGADPLSSKVHVSSVSGGDESWLGVDLSSEIKTI